MSNEKTHLHETVTFAINHEQTNPINFFAFG
jgi:hypothetical protein